MAPELALVIHSDGKICTIAKAGAHIISITNMNVVDLLC
ncbi:hypothetical protein BZL35_00662 [Candidatus Pandoraea novymonadis]|uniref:Uncharacterized protein n=1 Tax=Candidatus Pandoraea novymonadis TaxID=1808959 RepID=A0ABX5FFC3_9BURK|nr:hypothetical protein BZL35_00662 [Candidatus Pandoraea novymonadis]